MITQFGPLVIKHDLESRIALLFYHDFLFEVVFLKKDGITCRGQHVPGL